MIDMRPSGQATLQRSNCRASGHRYWTAEKNNSWTCSYIYWTYRKIQFPPKNVLVKEAVVMTIIIHIRHIRGTIQWCLFKVKNKEVNLKSLIQNMQTNTLCTFLPNSNIKADMSYVDGWAVNIRQVWKLLYVDGWAINIWQLFISYSYPFFFKNTNMSYVDGSAINIWHVCIDRAI